MLDSSSSQVASAAAPAAPAAVVITASHEGSNHKNNKNNIDSNNNNNSNSNSNSNSNDTRRNRNKSRGNNNNNNINTNNNNNKSKQPNSKKAKKKNSNNNNNNKNKNKNKNNGPPPPPQLKLAIRHIGNPAKNGSVKNLLENVLIPLIDECNNNNKRYDESSLHPEETEKSETLTSNHTLSEFYLDLDIASKRHLITQEEAVQEAQRKWEAIQNEKEQEKDNDNDNDNGDGTEKEKENSLINDNESKNKTETETGNDGMTTEEALKTKETELKQEERTETPSSIEVVSAPAYVPPAHVPIITVRPLYAAPPKTTRRRGDRPGILYILLTAPKLEAIPQELVVVNEEKVVEIPATSGLEKGKIIESNASDLDLNVDKDLSGSVTSGEAVAATTTTTTREADMTDVNNTTASRSISSGKTTKSNNKKSHDYSRQIAQGRLLLQNTMDRMIQIITSSQSPSTTVGDKDARKSGSGSMTTNSSYNKNSDSSSHTFSTLQVEVAMSGKTWKWQNSRSDRRENTLETTSDYKKWLKDVAQQQADLEARPKPTPGGGMAALASSNIAEESNNGTTLSTSGSQQPVAALVQHLRAKQEELKRKKQKKKKDIKSTKKSKGDKNRNTNSAANSKSSNNNSGKKNKNLKRNKKNAGRGGNDKKGTPTMATAVLKPPVSHNK